MATILAGHLKYLVREELQLAGYKWSSDKFELKGDGMVLVKFQQWGQF